MVVAASAVMVVAVIVIVIVIVIVVTTATVVIVVPAMIVVVIVVTTATVMIVEVMIVTVMIVAVLVTAATLATGAATGFTAAVRTGHRVRVASRCRHAHRHPRLRHRRELALEVVEGPLVAQPERFDVVGQVHHLHPGVVVGPAVVHRRPTGLSG